MSVAAAQVLDLQQLWADETLDFTVGTCKESTEMAVAPRAEAAVVAPRTAFLDPVMMSDGRVLKEMLRREDRERETVVSMRGYTTRSKDLRPHMRPMVVNWMFEVTDEQRCEPEVFPLSAVYLDRVVLAMDIAKNRLQLVAAVCMFIASKFRDSAPLDASSLAIYTDNSISVADLLEWELLVLEVLKWNLCYLTPYDFLDNILWQIDSLITTADPRCAIKRHAQTFANICIADNRFDGCPPSLVATACLYVSITGLNGIDWCNSVELANKLHAATDIEQECLQHWSEQIESSCQSMLMSSSTNVHCNSTDRSAMTNDQVDRVSETSFDTFQLTPFEVKLVACPAPVTPSDVREINLNDG